MASKVSSKTTTNQVGEEEARLELPPVIRFQPSSFYRHLFADVDLNKIDPWDQTGKEKMGDKEWYFFSHKDRKYPTGMTTNRTTASGYGKIFRGFMGEKKKDGVDVSSGDVRDRKYPTGMRTNRATACGYWEEMGKDKKTDGVDVSTGDMRFSTSDVLCDNMPWATRMEVVKEIASALVYVHSPWSRYHLDLKPSNILLDEKTENQLSDFGLPNLLHGDGAPSNNRSLDAKVSGKPSAKRGIDINNSSHTTHGRRLLRVRHHPLIQMLPTARKWSGDILTSCARLITSMRTFGIAEAGYWVSANPKYETPRAGPVSEYILRKLFGIRNELTENESQQHSDPDSCRSGHLKRAVNTKTSASWIVATSAPHHATGNRSLLSGFIMDHDDQFVHAVNRVPMKVLARGAVVTDAFILPDVWFVPGLTENLVSVSQLAELDHSIGFGRGECCIRSARDAKIVGKGRLQKGGHYVLDYLKVPLAI